MCSEKPPYRKYHKANCYQILYRWSEHKYVSDSHVYCVLLSNVKWQQNERKNNKIMYLVCGPTLSSTGCLLQNTLHNRRVLELKFFLEFNIIVSVRYLS